MWGPLYVSLGAFATGMTIMYLVERAIVFTSASAMVSWLVLAYQAELAVVSNGARETFAVGPIRWLWVALGLLSMVALVGAILGYYPESETPTEDTYQV